MIPRIAVIPITPPAKELVTVDDVFRYTRVDNTEDTPDIERMIKAAVDWCRMFTRRCFVTSTYKQFFCRFPSSRDPIELWCPPLQSVTSITYTDPNGDEQTLDSSQYTVHTEIDPGRVYPARNVCWPDVDTQTPSPVSVTFVNGYGDPEDVPEAIRQAALMLVEHWYNHRGVTTTLGKGASSPMSVESLLWPYRIEL